MGRFFCVFVAFAGVLLPGVSAHATDKFDAWINIFAAQQLSVTELVDQTGRTSGGQSFFQQIRGSVDGVNACPLLIRIQKGQAVGALDGAQMRAILRSKERFVGVFTNVEPGDVEKVEKLRVRRGFGSVFAAKGSRFFLSAIRGDASSLGMGAYEFAVSGIVCERGWGVMESYLSDTIDKSSRDRNLADFAAFQQNTDSGARSAPAKPRIYRDCEAAEGSSDRMAAFMQGLTQDQLSRFLANGQQCSTFAGG